MKARLIQMNNQVIFAAAGNGKTYSLCSKAKAAVENGNKYVLLLSYTNEGIRSLENEYRKQNDGILDEKVIFKSWYSFLLSDFIKPYQCSLKLKEKRYKQELPVTFPENFVSSIAFYNTDPPPRWYNQNHVQYFVNQRGDVTPDRVSHLAYLCNDHSNGKALGRMEEIYSHIFIDELQDYAGWDLEIIRLLFDSQILITCVGDYKQATYRTNNSPKNSQYRDENIRNYFKLLEKEGVCTTSYANTTRRFNCEICDKDLRKLLEKKGYISTPLSDEIVEILNELLDVRNWTFHNPQSLMVAAKEAAERNIPPELKGIAKIVPQLNPILIPKVEKYELLMLASLTIHTKKRIDQFGAVIKSMKADYQEMYSSIKDKPLLMTACGPSDEVQ